MTRAKRKNPNRAGTDARKRKDGRYETRATLNTPTGRRRVSFYGATAEEANNKKFQALADQAKGILFSDPGRLTVGEYLHSWLTDTARSQVSEGTFERYERACRVHLVPFLKATGLPSDVRFHDLRHTAGTLALRQGMPLHAVSKMLGHSDPAMTLRRYAHVLEDMEDEGGRAMDELF